MKKYDLIVIGGGFSGVAAAIAAAREGVKVLLIEKNNSLGGAVSNCLVNPFMKYKVRIPKKDGTFANIPINSGIFASILRRLKKMDGYRPDGVFGANDLVFNEEYVKFICEELCEESEVEVLFQTILTDAKVENGRIIYIKVFNKNGFIRLYADYFIDASGDADLSFFAGVPCRLGRESDHLCQPMTLCFRLGNVDMEKFRTEKKLINPLYKKFQRAGQIKNPRENVLIFNHIAPGVLHFNTTRIIKRNPVDTGDITIAQIEARRQVFEMYNFLKENFSAFQNAVLLMTAPEIGIRESRKIWGEYTLTKEDIISYRRFEDAIACGAYEIDIHSPEGTGTEIVYLDPARYYTIPYRCMLPKTVDNLLVAGRCISSTQEAQSAIRILPIVCNIGEAAGAAIAVCCINKCDVKQADIKSIQIKLESRGARCR